MTPEGESPPSGRGRALRVLLVCSSGGHLSQLLPLRPWWGGHERVWVTFPTLDARSKLADERVVWAAHPTTRNIPNLIRNLGIALRQIRRVRPDVVVSTGAGVAVPFVWGARLFGIATVYVEVVDRIDGPTLTGRLCRPVTDLFLVQWQDQLRFYRGSILLGPVW